VKPLLDVRNLSTVFHTPSGDVHAVKNVSYALEAGESLAIVGESGSGKSVSVLSLIDLVPPPGKVENGQVEFKNRDVLKLQKSDLQRLRGREIGMVFQDPMTSLNPVLSVGYQLTEALKWHMHLNKTDARKQVIETLHLVGISNAEERLVDYPHQFSGGQRQRIMIAMAIVCRPDLLIADEPTTALDVTIQAQIVDLIKALQEKFGMAVIWITHDLALVAGIVDRVAVMYAGSIIEYGTVDTIFTKAAHPYTQCLLRSMPGNESTERGRLYSIEGNPPDLRQQTDSCPFAPRCPQSVERCLEKRPSLEPATSTHRVACWRSNRQ
jgi:oligopeptide/dipeptide ABC transporter ATP-binding protein